jgi:hypothetical protein
MRKLARVSGHQGGVDDSSPGFWNFRDSGVKETSMSGRRNLQKPFVGLGSHVVLIDNVCLHMRSRRWMIRVLVFELPEILE